MIFSLFAWCFLCLVAGGSAGIDRLGVETVKVWQQRVNNDRSTIAMIDRNGSGAQSDGRTCLTDANWYIWVQLKLRRKLLLRRGVFFSAHFDLIALSRASTVILRFIVRTVLHSTDIVRRRPSVCEFSIFSFPWREKLEKPFDYENRHEIPTAFVVHAIGRRANPSEIVRFVTRTAESARNNLSLK